MITYSKSISNLFSTKKNHDFMIKAAVAWEEEYLSYHMVDSSDNDPSASLTNATNLAAFNCTAYFP